MKERGPPDRNSPTEFPSQVDVEKGDSLELPINLDLTDIGKTVLLNGRKHTVKLIATGIVEPWGSMFLRKVDNLSF
jgi:hypothetical protein